MRQEGLLVGAVAALLLLAGCTAPAATTGDADGALPIGSGGDGGGASIGGSASVFMAEGGAGTDARPWRDGEDGCSVATKQKTLQMCGLALRIDGARLTVTAVDADIRWADLFVAVPETGFTIQTPQGTLSLDGRVDEDVRRPRAAPEVLFGGPLSDVFADEMQVGDRFEVHGSDPVDLWLWDARPVGAAVGIAMEPVGMMSYYTLDARIAVDVAGVLGETEQASCVDVPRGAEAFEATVQWSSMLPTAQRLGLSWPGGVAYGAPGFTAAGTVQAGDVLRIFVPEDGATPEQEVRLRLQVTVLAHDEPVWDPQPALC